MSARRLRSFVGGCLIAATVTLLATGAAAGRRAEASTGGPWAQRAVLTDPAAGSTALLGEQVAVSGDTLVVSARFANGGKGEVLVYTKPASGWANATTPTATLTASDGASGDQFGDAVAISGNTIVVGAYAHKVGTHAAQGAAYVYVKPPSGWQNETESAELTATGGEAGDHFGYSVATDGSTIVVGAPGHAFGAVTEAGLGYVFVKPVAGWSGSLTNDAVLGPVTPTTNDLVGVSVGVSGTTAVVGSDGYATKGAVLVFSKPVSGWSNTINPTAILTASDGAANDNLGAKLAFDGSTIVAGAPFHKVGSVVQEGAIYVYVKPASGWAPGTQTAELNESDGQTNDDFGEAVAVSGPEIVAGSPGTGFQASRTVGSLYVFLKPAGGWAGIQSQAAEFDGPGTTSDTFGAGVATSGGTAFVGAPSLESAYVFDPGATATITAPANGATYTEGQQVIASYACTATPPATLNTCTGPVATGAPVDTSTLGTHTFSVTATASDGVAVTQTATYTVAAPPPPPPPAPLLGPVHISHKTFRTGSKLASIAAGHHKRKRPPVGTTFTTTLNTPATLALTFTTRTKHKPKAAGALTLQGHAGTDTIRFQGRISKHRKLKPGRYRLTIVASNSTGTSQARAVSFTIARG